MLESQSLYFQMTISTIFRSSLSPNPYLVPLKNDIEQNIAIDDKKTAFNFYKGKGKRNYGYIFDIMINETKYDFSIFQIILSVN